MFIIGFLIGLVIFYPVGYYIGRLGNKQHRQKQKAGDNAVQTQIAEIRGEEDT